MAKLAAEIRSAFSDVEEIRLGHKLGSLLYLRAVVCEEVLPGDIEIDGEWIPPEARVGASSYVVHHNEEYSPDASWTRTMA
jgi:hypothetical protein